MTGLSSPGGLVGVNLSMMTHPHARVRNITEEGIQEVRNIIRHPQAGCSISIHSYAFLSFLVLL
jgi:hypothetical protein